MTTLVEFLLARIADDEAYARNAFADHNDVKPEWSEIWSGAVDLGDGEYPLATNDSQVSRHIVRWDPRRVLAECTVKRRIVERAQSMEYAGVRLDGTQMNGILADLALPYADHPDYHEEWRP